MRYLLTIALLIVLLATFVWLAESGYPVSRSFLNGITVANWALLLLVLIHFLPRGHGSICFLYFLSFSIFHLGLVIATTFAAVSDPALLSYITTWFFTETADYAIMLSNVGCLGFTIAALLSPRPAIAAYRDTTSEPVLRRVSHIGGAILVVTVLLFAVLFYSSGAYRSYSAYLAVVRGSPAFTQAVSWIYVFIGIGVVLITACYKTRGAKLYLTVFGIWAVFAFQLGLRGEVMFPGMVALCLFARQRRFFNPAIFLGLLLAFLVVAGIVRNARSTGDYTHIEYVGPANAVAEMGSSLRSVYETVSWREAGDSYIWGQSYWAPFERQIALVVPGIERLPAREDQRLLNILIEERAGPFGYSPVAEAYRNFGIIGVVLIMALLGALMAWMDRVPSTVRNNVLIGAVLVPLFIHIRNNFGPVPVQVFISVAFGLAVLTLARVRVRY